MKIALKTITISAAAALAFASTPAWAGKAVHGYGETRSEAVRDANHSAAEMSRNRFGRTDCRTPAKPTDCTQDDGGWVCIAYVANHQGSCGF